MSRLIKQFAVQVGFDVCGITKAEDVGNEKDVLRLWLDRGYNAEMGYMANYFDKRCDPTLLVEGAKSIICVALNYYPEVKQNLENPQFAYYAYGKDYHDVIKEKLRKLFNYLLSLVPNLSGRFFCDTAPVLERHWATKSGIGFIGKNGMLIIPHKGSYFLLGELIVDVELEYDRPMKQLCGNCTKCIDACPTNALEKPYLLNSNKCISYQTIENKGEISFDVKSNLNNKVFGCDICQQVCPWNRFAKPTSVGEFIPKQDLLDITGEKLLNMTPDGFNVLFKGSAVKRAKYCGLKRNMQAIVDSDKTES
ncbi:MAG: tRNA epoxyqueuosine(34) reductase QueG [Dysgonomonas sp.]